MSKSKKQSFVQGASILVIASLLVKVIGAGFKIPLTHLIDDEGMGIFNSAYQIYTVMFIIATAGFPTAISKMVAESLALDRKREAERIFRIAIVILAVIGITGSLVLFYGADFISVLIGGKSVPQAIRSISPAVLCVAFMAVFRGYFQGRQNMYPTAVSEVIEAFGKLLFGYLLAWMFIENSVEKAASGAVFGVTMGTFFGFLSLLVIFVFYKKGKADYLPNEITASYRSLTKKLIRIAVPITIGASVSSLTNLADMFTVMHRLQDIVQVTPEFLAKYQPLLAQAKNFDGVAINDEVATALYGLYTGKPITLFNFPLAVIVALGMSVVPAIAGALAKGDKTSAQNSVKTVVKLTLVFSIPCAVGLYVLSAPILQIVFGDSLATTLLEKLAVSIVFVSMLQITTSILQAYGRTVVPVVNMFVGGLIKVVVNFNLVAVPSINIDGAPIGTMVCYFTVMLLNMIWILKETKCKFGMIEYLIKPLLASGIMGAVAYFIYNGLISFGTIPALGVSIIAAVFVYFAMLLIIKIFNEEDILMLPKGDKILSLLNKFHLI